jgi:hypothetical protein
MTREGNSMVLVGSEVRTKEAFDIDMETSRLETIYEEIRAEKVPSEVINGGCRHELSSVRL